MIYNVTVHSQPEDGLGNIWIVSILISVLILNKNVKCLHNNT